MARETGLEPATSGVTGRRSNQLSYSRVTRVYLRNEGDLKARSVEVKDVALAVERRAFPQTSTANHTLPAIQTTDRPLESSIPAGAFGTQAGDPGMSFVRPDQTLVPARRCGPRTTLFCYTAGSPDLPP